MLHIRKSKSDLSPLTFTQGNLDSLDCGGSFHSIIWPFQLLGETRKSLFGGQWQDNLWNDEIREIYPKTSPWGVFARKRLRKKIELINECTELWNINDILVLGLLVIIIWHNETWRWLWVTEWVNISLSNSFTNDHSLSSYYYCHFRILWEFSRNPFSVK